VLLVPDPARLDTRTTRLDQLGTASADVVDPRRRGRPTPTWSTHADVVDPRPPEGRLGVRPGPAWTLIATVTGAYGPARLGIRRS